MPTYSPTALAGFTAQSSSTNYLPLLSDGDDVVSRGGSVASGIGVLKRGTILKIDPATGAVTVPATAADCNCVLAEDVDATAATVACVVYLSGKVKADALTWPGALGHGVVSDALRNYGILVESVVFTDGSLIRSNPTAEMEAQAKKTIADNKAHEKKAATAEEAEKPKPSDGPWAYLTPDEKEKNPELAEIHPPNGEADNGDANGKAAKPHAKPETTIPEKRR